MIIFKDVISGDELFSDTFKYKVFENVLYRVEGKMTTERTDIDDSMFGGNASAEDGGEAYESEAVSGINIVLAHKLVETNFGKKDYQKYLKGYMKGLKGKLEELLEEAKENKTKPQRSEEDIAAFIKNTPTVVKDFILKNFDDFQFFLGEKMDCDGMVVLCRWEEEVPVLYFFLGEKMDCDGMVVLCR